MRSRFGRRMRTRRRERVSNSRIKTALQICRINLRKRNQNLNAVRSQLDDPADFFMTNSKKIGHDTIR